MRFVKAVSQGSNVEHFIIHARKCLLNGLSPHQNRTIPPLKCDESVKQRPHSICSAALRYEWVFALKRDFPDLQFSLNGGIQSLTEVQNVLNHRLDDGASVRLTLLQVDFKGRDVSVEECHGRTCRLRSTVAAAVQC